MEIRVAGTYTQDIVAKCTGKIVDIRQYVNTRKYEGPTKKGIRFDVEHVNEILKHLPVQFPSKCDNDAVIAEIKDKHTESLIIRFIKDKYSKGNIVLDMRRYVKKK